MPKNDNPHAIRLIHSIRQHAGDAAADAFAAAHPLSKSADIDKKFQWAADACRYLDEQFDTDEIKSIRKECRCNDGKSIAKKLLKYLRRTDSISAFVDDFNANESFAHLEYRSDHEILFCYPECYCSCVKRVPGALSKTWCYCTLGNAEGIFREVFHDDVQVTLVSSIKTGGARCEMQVKW